MEATLHSWLTNEGIAEFKVLSVLFLWGIYLARSYSIFQNKLFTPYYWAAKGLAIYHALLSSRTRRKLVRRISEVNIDKSYSVGISSMGKHRDN